MDGQLIQVTVRPRLHPDAPTIVVPGQLFAGGSLAVTPGLHHSDEDGWQYTSGWRVIHVPTGMRLPGWWDTCSACAESYARMLADLPDVDWSAITLHTRPDLVAATETIERVTAIAEQVAKGCAATDCRPGDEPDDEGEDDEDADG